MAAEALDIYHHLGLMNYYRYLAVIKYVSQPWDND
jgi:hypothetical protein